LSNKYNHKQEEAFMQLRFLRKRFCLVLAGIAILLGILGYVTAAYEWSLGVNNSYWAHEAALSFGLIYESNIPSWYSALLLFIAAILAALISLSAADGKSKTDSGMSSGIQAIANGKFFWGLMAAILAYMSVDEAAVLHEILTVPLREGFQLSGFLFFGWILVGIPLAIIVAIIFIPFLLRLPRFCQISFVLAAFIYLTGAVVVESYSASLFALTEYATLPYHAISTLEELMEMSGVIIVIHALLWYLETQIGEIKIQIA
jgi:hypothetical protein